MNSTVKDGVAGIEKVRPHFVIPAAMERDVPLLGSGEGTTVQSDLIVDRVLRVEVYVFEINPVKQRFLGVAVNRGIEYIKRPACGSKLHIQINNVVQLILQIREIFGVVGEFFQVKILLGQEALQLCFKLIGK